MINPQKVELMSKVALYEHTEGKSTLKLNRYYQKDSRHLGRMRSLPFGVLAYLLIAFIVLMMGMDETKGRFPFGANPILLALIVIVCGVGFVLLYQNITSAVFGKQYENKRSSLRGYRLNLQRLDRLYDEEQRRSEEAQKEQEEQKIEQIRKDMEDIANAENADEEMERVEAFDTLLDEEAEAESRADRT